MSSPLADSAMAVSQHPQMQRSPRDLREPCATKHCDQARNHLGLCTGQERAVPRRTPEAQAAIAAARAAPGNGFAPQFPEDDRTIGIPLDAVFSNAAIADTPAVREMGGPARKRGGRKARARLRLVVSSPGSEANALVDMVAALLGDSAGLELDEVEVTDELLRSLEGKWTDPDTFATCLNGQEVRLRRPASVPVRGDTPPLPPDAIILTGPDAEQYRAITAAARKAQASTATARADSAALLQLFQAFCVGLAPEPK